MAKCLAKQYFSGAGGGAAPVAAEVGWQWTQSNFTARLDGRIPLIWVNSRDRTWLENGLYFS